MNTPLMNDRFNALPVSDRIIKSICGRTESEILFGDVKLGKELQKTVLEIIPRFPADNLASLETRTRKRHTKILPHFPWTLLAAGTRYAPYTHS